MYIEMQLTSKGQVTIPKIFRDMLGVRPRSKVRFSTSGGQVVISGKRRKKSEQGIIEALWGKGDIPITTDEVMRMTRGD